MKEERQSQDKSVEREIVFSSTKTTSKASVTFYKDGSMAFTTYEGPNESMNDSWVYFYAEEAKELKEVFKNMV